MSHMGNFAFIVMVAVSCTFLANALVMRLFGQKKYVKYLQLGAVPLVVAGFIIFIGRLPIEYAYYAGLVPVVILAFIVGKYYIFDKKDDESKQSAVQAKKFDRKKRIKNKNPGNGV